MSDKKDKKEQQVPEQDPAPETAPQAEAETGQQPEPEQPKEEQAGTGPSPEETIAAQQDRYLRLAAEYDNFRKRSQKEKESLWSEAKADTVAAFLPVYDNLERAIRQETADEAYKRAWR